MTRVFKPEQYALDYYHSQKLVSGNKFYLLDPVIICDFEAGLVKDSWECAHCVYDIPPESALSLHDTYDLGDFCVKIVSVTSMKAKDVPHEVLGNSGFYGIYSMALQAWHKHYPNSYPEDWFWIVEVEVI